MTGPEIGEEIHRLGEQWATGKLTLADATAQLRKTVPTLTQYGATLQIKAWRGARSRYQPIPELPTQSHQRPMTEAALLREPIRFRFTA